MSIRSRKHPSGSNRHPQRALGALSLATGLALSAHVMAATGDDVDASQRASAKDLPAMKVQASAVGDFKTDYADSPKYSQPLLDTTQTLSIISKEILAEQGATTLTEALRNSPGVGTFYVGENGSTNTGDAIYMRGFDTAGSIFVDGIRDLGSISRDVFNIEQVEVLKGPAGTDSGRTAPSGSVTLVSKQPHLGNRSSGQLSWGSGDQRRGTLDWNRQLGEHSAFRLNLMRQDGGVPGRDTVENNRWGIAPSVAFGLGTPTRVYVDLLHVAQDNLPDGGVPTIGLPGYSTPDPARPELGTAARVDSANFYGTLSDHDNVDADMLTVRVIHEINGNATLFNTTRWGRNRQDYLLTSFMGRDEYLHTPNIDDPSTWTIDRRIPTFKNQDNRILANQTQLVTSRETGRIRHDLTAGLELLREKLETTGMGALNGTAWPAASLYHPAPDVSGLEYGPTGDDSSGRTDTGAVYLFDTLTFSPKWQLNGGVRLDHYNTQFSALDLCGGRRGPDCAGQPEGTPLPSIDAEVSGTLFNWKLGTLYKPTPEASLYANLAASSEPPGGENLELSSRASSGDNPDFNPRRARTAEVGGKWELNDGGLLLSAALYRTVVDNLVEQDPVDQQYYQIGRKRVQGVELGAVGRISDNWSVSAGYTTMDAKITRGEAESQDGSGDLAYTPSSAFTAWSSWRLPAGFRVALGVRYNGRLKRGHDGAVGTPEYVRSWWVADAMLGYQVSPHLDLQLNLYNLGDSDYVAAINKSGYRYTPGQPRSALFSARFRF